MGEEGAKLTYTQAEVAALIAAHAADLDAHTKDLMEVLKTGEYQPFAGGQTTAAALTSGKMLAFPIVVARNITIDRIAVEVTAQAGQKFRLGIYNDGINLYPGTLLKDAGEVTLASTGIKAIIIDPALALAKGIYHLAIASDGVPTLSSYHVMHRGPDILGITVTAFTYWLGWGVTFTYAALPTPFTAGGAAGGYHRPIIALRIASLA